MINSSTMIEYKPYQTFWWPTQIDRLANLRGKFTIIPLDRVVVT